jgi:sugar phosphate isomerase/epimerase
VDVAAQLGVPLMRHDVAWRPRQLGDEAGLAGVRWAPEAIAIARFEEALPRMVAACQEVADYARQLGITTTVENHLFFVQASDRVQRLINLVNRPNFRSTVDIGNFLCVDESPVVGVSKNLPYAKMIHLKDFYVRPSYANPGEGWFRSAYGTYLRGAVFGQGDMDVREIFRIIKAQNYDGYASIEFEGLEDPEWGTAVSLANAMRLWQET